MIGIERLEVSMLLEGEKVEVGELVLHKRELLFKYYPAFLKSGLNISPIKLPFEAGVQKGDPRLFDGLFGVFNDSLPDGWGRLLLNRSLTTLGKNPFELSSLDRLAYVGQNGSGALIYEPTIENSDYRRINIELDQLAEQAQELIEGTSAELIEELFALGGSSGGARPKIYADYNKQEDKLALCYEELPENFERWIIKFPASSDQQDIAQIEYAYYLMAREANIQMTSSRLFEGSSGKKYFGTQRFDRIGDERLHMHSASGLLHDDFRYSQLDYGHLLNYAFELERDVRIYDKVFRLAAFNLFAHNRDDHSKNFSFLMNGNGQWEFAPAYDLTFSYSSQGHHSTMFAGESKSPSRAHLMKLAQKFNIKNAEKIIAEVEGVVNNWSHFADQASVSNDSRILIDSVLRGIKT